MLVDNIQKNVLDEEMARICVCECCERNKSCFIYLVKEGICTIISHVCKSCGYDLEDTCVTIDREYQLLKKKFYKQ